MKINFFDLNTGMDKYTNMHWPCDLIEYIKPPLMEFDGISVFTDELCFHEVVDKVKSKYKIAWALESPVVKPYVESYIRQVEHKFDYIYMYNPPKDNLKYKQSYFGACWIIKENCKIYEKNKLLSIVASNKNSAPGHKLRHEVISRKLHKDLELWGSGYNWFSDKPEDRVKPFKDYMYVIVVENCQYPNYFTDKIIDCFATGCIPIYWGDPNMDQHFNKNGFYTWNTIEDLIQILAKIGPEDYYSKIPYIKENYDKFEKFASPDKWMYENCFNVLK